MCCYPAVEHRPPPPLVREDQRLGCAESATGGCWGVGRYDGLGTEGTTPECPRRGRGSVIPGRAGSKTGGSSAPTERRAPAGASHTPTSGTFTPGHQISVGGSHGAHANLQPPLLLTGVWPSGTAHAGQ